MSSNLNPGFVNNINTIEVRVNGAHSQRLTDRAIDINGDGVKEVVTIQYVSGSAKGTPSAPGGKMRTRAVVPSGVARSVVSQSYELDGGVNHDYDVNEFTQGF